MEIHSQVANIIYQCVHIMKRDWSVKISHVFREQNRLADSIARLAYGHTRGLRVFKDPRSIQGAFNDDLQSIPMARSFVKNHIQS